MKYNPQNERIKRAYFTLLKQADQMADSTIDGVRKAILRMEESTGWADFATFNSDQAIAFKKHLAKSHGGAPGKPLSKNRAREAPLLGQPEVAGENVKERIQRRAGVRDALHEHRHRQHLDVAQARIDQSRQNPKF